MITAGGGRIGAHGPAHVKWEQILCHRPDLLGPPRAHVIHYDGGTAIKHGVPSKYPNVKGQK